MYIAQKELSDTLANLNMVYSKSGGIFTSSKSPLHS